MSVDAAAVRRSALRVAPLACFLAGAGAACLSDPPGPDGPVSPGTGSGGSAAGAPMTGDKDSVTGAGRVSTKLASAGSTVPSGCDTLPGRPGMARPGSGTVGSIPGTRGPSGVSVPT